jgi:hypothetical protein
MEYICLNKECVDFNKKEYLSSESFFFCKGRLIGKHSQCSKCGFERMKINDNESIPLSRKNVQMNMFDSMSADEKREKLKQRAHNHFNKEVKERKNDLLGRAMKEMKDLTSGKL